MKSIFSIFLASSVACGGPSGEPACPRSAGKFCLESRLVASDGDCDRAPRTSEDEVSFDADGKFEPPLPGLIRCTTTQDGCSLSVRCSSMFNPAKLEFDGSVFADGEGLTGTATFTGEYKGCLSVVYAVEGTRCP